MESEKLKVKREHLRDVISWDLIAFFEKTKFDCVPLQPPRKILEVKVTRERKAVDIEIIQTYPLPQCETTVDIQIGGLHEGLTSIESLHAKAKVSCPSDMFYIWDAVEEMLLKASKFLTLIDIYGHYANRGDTVVVKTDVYGSSLPALQRSLSFFGNSSNCGIPLPRASMKSILYQKRETEVDEIVSSLRAMRYDIRTNKTHPTISAGMILCTYPFPLLSRKAHLERRLKHSSFSNSQESAQPNFGGLKRIGHGTPSDYIPFVSLVGLWARVIDARDGHLHAIEVTLSGRTGRFSLHVGPVHSMARRPHEYRFSKSSTE